MTISIATKPAARRILRRFMFRRWKIENPEKQGKNKGKLLHGKIPAMYWRHASRMRDDANGRACGGKNFLYVPHMNDKHASDVSAEKRATSAQYSPREEWHDSARYKPECACIGA